jgi:hypothetical protein
VRWLDHQLTDPRQFGISYISALADGDRMQFDQLKRSEFITLLGGAVDGGRAPTLQALSMSMRGKTLWVLCGHTLNMGGTRLALSISPALFPNPPPPRDQVQVVGGRELLAHYHCSRHSHDQKLVSDIQVVRQSSKPRIHARNS